MSRALPQQPGWSVEHQSPECCDELYMSYDELHVDVNAVLKLCNSTAGLYRYDSAVLSELY
jgi:hypothetical protein